MGFTYMRVAGNTLDLIDQCAQASRNGTDEKSSNVICLPNGRRFFYEVSRRDQKDGGIRGTVHEMISSDRAMRVGEFRIDGKGNLVRAHMAIKAVLSRFGEEAKRTLARRGY